MKDILLMTTKGEAKMMKDLWMLTSTDIFDAQKLKTIWNTVSNDFSINPFGKLYKTKGRYLPNGRVQTYPSYFHGWFASLKCTDEFYEQHKVALKDYDVSDEKYYSREHMPKWFTS